MADHEGSAIRDGPDALPDPVPVLRSSRAFHHCPYERPADTDSEGAVAADDRHCACQHDGLEHICRLWRPTDGIGSSSHPRLYHAGVECDIATWLLKEPFTKRRALGCALGGAGLLLLLGEEIQAVGRSPLGAILMIGAAVSWAIGTIMMKRWPVSLPVSTFTAWQLLISVPPIILFAIIFESGTFNPFALSLWPMLGVFYNVFVAFIFCQWAWMKIVLIAPVGVSSLSVMMTPVVGVFSGMLLLGETPHWQDYVALVLVVTSLATVLMPAKPITPRS